MLCLMLSYDLDMVNFMLFFVPHLILLLQIVAYTVTFSSDSIQNDCLGTTGILFDYRMNKIMD